MTNNPDKLRQREAHGTRVAGRIPHEMPANAHNQRYLETKATRSGHLLDLCHPAPAHDAGGPAR